MPKRDHGVRTVLVNAEHEPLLQFLAEPAPRPPLADAGMPLKCPMACPSLGQVQILFVTVLLKPPAGLRVQLGQLDIELPGQIQRRLDRATKTTHCGSYVHHITVESARETMHMVAVEVHGWVAVLVAWRHAASLTGSLHGQDLLQH